MFQMWGLEDEDKDEQDKEMVDYWCGSQRSWLLVYIGLEYLHNDMLTLAILKGNQN